MSLDAVYDQLSKRYGVKAKVKTGKPYATMHQAKPSNAMGIVLVKADGTATQIHTSIVNHRESLDNFEHVLFLYIGNNYLTVNVYSARDVKSVGSSMPEWKGREREARPPEINKHTSGERLKKHTETQEKGKYDPNYEDVPW